MDDSSCNKGFAKDILDSVIIHGNKRHPKCVSNKKKHRVVQTSKLMTKHYEKVRGILKKHKNDGPGQNATICSLQSASQVTPCGIQHSNRHVRFSGKDDILGPRMKSVSSFEKSLCNLYLDSFASSSEKHQLMASEKELATVNEMDGDGGSITIENGTGPQRMIEKDVFPNGHDRVDIPNFLRQHISSQEKLKHLPEKSISLSSVHDGNLHMFDRGNHITCHRPTYAGIPNLISTLNKINNPRINSHFGGAVARASNSSHNFVDFFENHSHGIAEMTSMENTRGFLQPSSSGFTLNGSANVRLPSASDNMTGHTSQPGSHLSTVGSLYPFPEWKQRTASFSENFMNDECFGLPLNSQGELIQASSNDRGSFNQIKKTSVGTGLSSFLPVDSFDLQRFKGGCSRMNERHFVERALSEEQLNLFCGEKYVKENHNLYIPARLGISGPQVTAKDGVNCLNSGNGSNHPICWLDSDQNMMNSFNGFGQYDQLQNQERNRLIPSKQNSDFMSLNTRQLTMRLMGKDVAIGGSSREMQGNPDGKVWTDKEIIAEHRSSGTAPDNLSVKRHFQEDFLLNPASGKSIQTLEIQSSEAQQSNAPMKAPGSRPFHPYVNCKTNDVLQNPILPSNRNHSPKSHHIAYLPTFPSLFSRETNFQEPFISGSEILGVSSHLPSVSTPHINQHLQWSPANPEYKQNHPQGTKSAFNFPFLHPDCSEPIQQSWFRSSTEGLLPWLHATPQVKTSLVPCQPFGDIDGRFHPHTTEINLLATPSVHRPNVVYSSGGIISQSHMQSSVGPASVVQPSSIPAFSDIRPTFSIGMSYGNGNMVIDRMQSKACGIIGLDHCQKMRKRCASKENDLTKDTKKPNLGIPEDLSVVTELTREDYQRNNEFFAGVSQCNSNRDRAGSSLCGPLEKQEDASAAARLARHNLNQENGQFELYSDSAEASGVGCVSNDSQSIGVGTSAGIDSSKLDSMGRSGPVKLSAGAKHIFKPSQNINQDNSRLVHLTIPFAGVSDSNIFLESQKKSTKIYRF